jgi:DNA polymerase I-like protein with 3'-5' exonuclease and polymerase domains
METVIVDLETTFSSDHTLKKMSVEEYVRNPKFEIIGAAIIAADRTKDRFFLSDQFFIGDYAKNALTHLAKHTAFCAHHAQFDGFALMNHWGIKPLFWYDTLSMARCTYPRLESWSLESLIEFLALGKPKSVPYKEYEGKTAREIWADQDLTARIGQGALHDAVMTLRLHELMKLILPISELKIIDKLIRLFTEPVLVGDQDVLQRALNQEIEKKKAAVSRAGLSDKALRSDKKLASALFGLGVEPPKKLSKTTGKAVFAFAKTDEQFRDLKGHHDARVRDLVEARLAVKTSIAETRSARLLDTAKRGCIPVYLRHYGAHTGRPSGGDKTNLTNLPRGSDLRRGLRAPKNHVLVWGDYAQIECRFLATVSGATKLLDAFRAGRKVYEEFGSVAFSTPITKVGTPEQYHWSKETVLGSGYGMGPRHHNEYLRNKGIYIPQGLSEDLIGTYRTLYPEVPAYWKKWNGILDCMYDYPNFTSKKDPVYIQGKFVILPNGMVIDYEGLVTFKGQYGRAFRLGKRSIWGGTATENEMQALAWILTKEAWQAVEDEGVHVVHTMYDELLCCVPLRDEKATRAILLDKMGKPPLWLPSLPVEVEIESNECYTK